MHSRSLRINTFAAAVGLLIVSVVMYPIHHYGSPCGREATSIEWGLACSLLAFVLGLFGYDWKRIALCALALVLSYFYFSRLAWLVQMQC